MTDNVVIGNVVTLLDVPAERVLLRAREARLESVVILGYDPDGNEYFASSVADGATVVWLMERCKLQLLRTGED